MGAAISDRANTARAGQDAAVRDPATVPSGYVSCGASSEHRSDGVRRRVLLLELSATQLAKTAEPPQAVRDAKPGPGFAHLVWFDGRRGVRARHGVRGRRLRSDDARRDCAAL